MPRLGRDEHGDLYRIEAECAGHFYAIRLIDRKPFRLKREELREEKPSLAPGDSLGDL